MPPSIIHPMLWTFLQIRTFLSYGHFTLWTLFHMDILPYGQFADSPHLLLLIFYTPWLSESFDLVIRLLAVGKHKAFDEESWDVKAPSVG